MYGSPFIRLILVSLAILTGASSVFASEPSVEEAWKAETLIICSEDAGWPPFSFAPNETRRYFSGFNQDLFNKIFTANSIAYQVVIKPWKRCLRDALSGEVHMVLDGAKNPQRDIDYLFTEPVYELKPVYFFAAGQALARRELSDVNYLKSLKVCGQKGYTYNNFGFDNSQVEQISKGLSKVFDLVLIGRCDIGLGREEILRSALGSYDKADRIDYRAIPNVSPEKFYWLLSREHDFAPSLKAFIDSEIAHLYWTGEAKELLNSYY